VRLKGLRPLKKKIAALIGNQTRDLTACSLVPQPERMPAAVYLPGKYDILNGTCHFPRPHIIVPHPSARAGSGLSSRKT
jgi:hypothetical protein